MPLTAVLIRSLVAVVPTRTIYSTQKIKRSLSLSAMENPSSSVLVLFGKTSVENSLSQSMRNSKNLNLPDGSEVSILLSSEMEKSSGEESFRAESYMNSLSTAQFGRFLIWSPRLASTHDVVSHNFSELPIGTACVADVQFKGRGRSKNTWESPKGCLMFSFILQMEDGRIVPLLQYVVSLAITESIKVVCDAKGLPHLDVKIKWPNDLYLNGLKVGGILCTSTYKSKKFNVSVGKGALTFCSPHGIGLNVDNKRPTTCLNAVLQEMTSASCQIRKEDILVAFFKRFEYLFDIFLNQGFQALEELYYNSWLHSGQTVIVQEKKEDETVEDFVVTIQGLTSSGYLLATGEGNQKYELHPDGNSFDFFKGLIRKKLG